MIKAVLSNELKAKQERIRNLPKVMEGVMLGALKGDAEKVIKFFHDGIKKEEFGFVDLMDSTVAGKQVQGFKQPGTPLYGKGDAEEKKSYVNMLRIRKIKDGWKVYPSWAKHWKSDLKLRDLFIVHEYGTTIERKDGTVIRIPARPALLMAYKKLMGKKGDYTRETSRIVKQAIKAYIKDAEITAEAKKLSRLVGNKEHEE